MIVLFTGKPGAGKSLAIMREIVRAVEAGKPVATNIPLRPGWERQMARANIFRRFMPGAVDKWEQRFRDMVFISDDLDELMRVRLHGEGEERGLMALDEIHRRLNARTWDAEVSDELERDDRRSAREIKDAAIAYRLKLTAWFSGHRHYGWKVIIGVQDADLIDRHLRLLYEYIVICRNLKRFKLGGVPLFPMNVFLQLWCWNDRKRTIVSRKLFFLRKSIASLYATHALAETDAPQDAIWLPKGGGGGRPEGGGAAPRTPAPPSLDDSEVPSWVV